MSLITNYLLRNQWKNVPTTTLAENTPKQVKTSRTAGNTNKKNHPVFQQTFMKDQKQKKNQEEVAAPSPSHLFQNPKMKMTKTSNSQRTPKLSTKPPPKKKAAIPWKWHADNPDNSEIPGLVHCTNCHKISGKFHYQHSTERCTWTAEREKAKEARRAPKLQAKAAAVEAPAPAPTESPEMERLRTELAHFKEVSQEREKTAFYAGQATRKDQLDA